MNDALYHEILDDAAELVRREGQRRRGKLAVSPETFAALEAIGVIAPVSVQPSLVQTENDDRVAALTAVAAEVAACTKCDLCKGRKQTVFSDGNPFAEVLFVGEGPGEQEDLKGVPFVGPAGQLLTDIIVKGMKLDRQRDTYICNVVKCRPPGNRNPSPEEMALCQPYLSRQLALVKPRVIVALGAVASQALLQTTATVGRLRGKWHRYEGIPLRVTYHPSYLLRTPDDKAKTWDDIKEVLKFLSGEVRLDG